MIVRMLSPIEPRCTGMCGALAISAPSASKIAQEKSSRSLMLTLVAVDCSATPISSAMAMNRLLKISSRTGIDVGADRLGAVERRRAGEHQRAIARPLGAPAGLDDDGRGRVEDQRGAADGFGSRRAGGWVAPCSCIGSASAAGSCRPPPRPAHRRSPPRPHPNSRSAADEASRSPRASARQERSRSRSSCRFRPSAAAHGGGVRCARRARPARSALARAPSQARRARPEKSSASGFSQLVSRIAFTSAMPMP